MSNGDLFCCLRHSIRSPSNHLPLSASTHRTSCPPLTLVAVRIDLYDPSCSHASLQNQSSSSRSACSGFVHDRWKPGTSAEIAAAVHHNHLSIWNEKMTEVIYEETQLLLHYLNYMLDHGKPFHLNHLIFNWKTDHGPSVFAAAALLSGSIYASTPYFSMAVRTAICQLSSLGRSSAVYSAILTMCSVASYMIHKLERD